MIAGLACALPGGETPDALAPVQTGVPVEVPVTEEAVSPAPLGDTPVPDEIGPPPDQTGPLEGPPIGNLTAEGPWLLFGTGEVQASTGLWAANADGSGATPLRVMNVADRQLEQGVSPDGRLVAFVGSVGDLYATPSLFMDRLPDTVGALELPLYGPQSQPSPDAGPGDPALEAMRAIVEQPSLAWSPDGSQLAFMGAIYGPTSDLYVYSVESREITQLTDGPSQAYQPFWSPDGKWIVHAGVSSFGTGAGYGVESVWAAAADGSEVRTIYDPNADFLSGDETFIGWVSDSTFLVHSWDAICGRRDIRSYDIRAPQSAVHWVGYFSSVAYAPEDRVLLVTVDDSVAGCPSEGRPVPKPGAHLIDVSQSGATQVVSGEVTNAVWSEVGAFYAIGGDSVMQIAPFGDGNVFDVPAPTQTLPVVSPDGQYWAWPAVFGTTGLWLGEYGQPSNQVSGEFVPAMTWSPDSGHFIYASDGALFHAAPPDFAFERTEVGLPVRPPLVWVMDFR
jgi:hypothetical protein